MGRRGPLKCAGVFGAVGEDELLNLSRLELDPFFCAFVFVAQLSSVSSVKRLMLVHVRHT